MAGLLGGGRAKGYVAPPPSPQIVEGAWPPPGPRLPMPMPKEHLSVTHKHLTLWFNNAVRRLLKVSEDTDQSTSRAI